MLFSAEGEKNNTFLKMCCKLRTCCLDFHVSASKKMGFITHHHPPAAPEVISAHYLS